MYRFKLRSKIIKYVFIDDEDKGLILKYKWHFAPSGRRGYAYSRINRRNIYMHRFILDVPKGKEIDHINRNGLDNRRVNLRLVTHQENMVNRSLQINNKSGFIGVSWNKKMNKWRSQVQRFGKVIHLGFFDNLEEASKARFLIK